MGQPMQSESLHPSSVAVTSEEAGAVFQSILHFPDSVQYETRRRAPTLLPSAAIPCHSMPFYVIPCHPMPCPTMLLPPCYHAAIPPPCYHAMTLPPCLALTMP
jgi:hypothetical protein